MDKGLTVKECLDFVYFRNALKLDRKSDDNIKHKLNIINTSDYNECARLAVWLAEMHRARKSAVNKCLSVYEAALQTPGAVSIDEPVLRKEILLLKGELVVEDIVEEQSWSVFKDRCRVVGDMERFRNSSNVH